jgi:hypothetical protein
LVPILLTFKDYREAQFNLLDALARSMVSRDFKASPAKAREASAADSLEEAKQLIEDALEDGEILVIVDALDELESKDRATAARRITEDLKKFSGTPAILSCRKAAWHGQLAELQPEVVEMSDFTPAAIRQFLRQWSFPPPKSSGELLHLIENQPHIGDLARTPLMLTILAFLYSQPKYHLPENRAEFYEVCARALLEEWDQHRNPDRANRFERHHKEYVLAELAYRHLCGLTPDADLDERTALDTIAEVMVRNSLKSNENGQLLTEIRENSGLLIHLPPLGLRFPHRTFLEFFAALHLLRQGSVAKVFEHYAADPSRWREVLLLYIGLNTRTDECSEAVGRLFATDSPVMTLSALADARAVKPEVARTILDNYETILKAEPDPALVTVLGYVASNPRTAHSERAAQILQTLLESAAVLGGTLPPELLEALLLASLRRPTENTTQFVVDHIDELQFRRILPLIGERAFILTTKIIGDERLSLAKKQEWIDGLRRAGGVAQLLDLLTGPPLEPPLADACAVALTRLSGTQDFRKQVAEWTDIQKLCDGTTESILAGWGWPYDEPGTEPARRILVYLASHIARMDDSPLLQDAKALEGANRRLLYLINGLRSQQAKPLLPLPNFEPWGSMSTTMSTASVASIRRVWKAAASPRWRRWVSFWGDDDVSLFLLFLTGIPVVVLCFWALASIVWSVFGQGSLGIHWTASMSIVCAASTVAITAYVRGYSEPADKRSEWAPILVALILGWLLPIVVIMIPLSDELPFTRRHLLMVRRLLMLLCLAAAVLGTLLLPATGTIRILFGLGVGVQAVFTQFSFEPATFPLVPNRDTDRLCRYLTAKPEQEV